MFFTFQQLWLLSSASTKKPWFREIMVVYSFTSQPKNPIHATFFLFVAYIPCDTKKWTKGAHDEIQNKSDNSLSRRFSQPCRIQYDSDIPCVRSFKSRKDNRWRHQSQSSGKTRSRFSLFHILIRKGMKRKTLMCPIIKIWDWLVTCRVMDFERLAHTLSISGLILQAQPIPVL